MVRICPALTGRALVRHQVQHASPSPLFQDKSVQSIIAAITSALRIAGMRPLMQMAAGLALGCESPHKTKSPTWTRRRAFSAEGR